MTCQRYVGVCVLAGSLALALGQTLAAATADDKAPLTADAVQEAFAKARKEEYQAADRQLRAVIDTKAFLELPKREQGLALWMSSAVAADARRWKEAQALAIRATGADPDNKDLWHHRFGLAFGMGDLHDAARSITTIAERWPSTLADIKDSDVLHIARDLGKEKNGQHDWLRMVEALRAADWRFSSQAEPSWLWRELTLYYIRHRDWERAAQVAGHVTNPQVLVGMRADRQFDRVLVNHRLANDIDRAITEEIDLLRVASRRAPEAMDTRNELAWALLGANRNEEALALVDETLARARAADNKDNPAFDDMNDQLNWAYDLRARALRALGRWDEAVAQWIEGRNTREQGDVNVSQVINLADFYCELGRPQEARAELETVGPMSPYGMMQLEGVRYDAALQLNDEAEARRALKYLREHQADAPSAYQWALALGNDAQAGAKLLIARLRDPDLRTEALADIQEYVSGARTPRQEQWTANFRAMIARPDVQRAVAKVGRIGRYNLVQIG